MSEYESCKDLPRTIQLDPDGVAADIRFQLYPHVCFPLTVELPIDIERICVKDEHCRAPASHFWNTIATLPPAELHQWVRENIQSAQPIRPNPKALALPGMAQQAMVSEEVYQARLAVQGRGGDEVKRVRPDSSASDGTADILENIQRGKMPLLERTVAGDTRILYLEHPREAKPKLSMILHFRMCTYKGDYGLGEVVSSFSLLPGEKTEIMIRTFEHDEVSQSKSESIFDSFSTSSADSFQQSLEQSVSSTSTSSSSAGKSRGGGFSIGGEIFGIKIGANASGGRNSSTSAAVSTVSTSVDSAVSTHTSQANAARNISIGSTSSATSISEMEQRNVRTIQNINWSRTLNFIFRRMNQEYVQITYLDQVSFHFTNGYTSQSATLDTLPALLDHITPDTPAGKRCLEKLLSAIRMELCNILDYQSVPHSFIECVPLQRTDCCDKKVPPQSYVLIRKKLGLEMEYAGQKVPGIITAVNRFVMRTPAVFVETVLGRGEALDCYNTRLQSAAARAAELANESLEHREAIIEAQATPLEKTDAAVRLKEAECCPDVSCGCHKE